MKPKHAEEAKIGRINYLKAQIVLNRIHVRTLEEELNKVMGVKV